MRWLRCLCGWNWRDAPDPGLDRVPAPMPPYPLLAQRYSFYLPFAQHDDWQLAEARNRAAFLRLRGRASSADVIVYPACMPTIGTTAAEVLAVVCHGQPGRPTLRDSRFLCHSGTSGQSVSTYDLAARLRLLFGRQGRSLCGLRIKLEMCDSQDPQIGYEIGAVLVQCSFTDFCIYGYEGKLLSYFPGYPDRTICYEGGHKWTEVVRGNDVVLVRRSHARRVLFEHSDGSWSSPFVGGGLPNRRPSG
jgi:hypothetical protein